jgi:hypothetical protein
MPTISIDRITAALADRVGPEAATALLAAALDDLNLPTQPAYAPEQVAAIGLAIANAGQQALAQQPEAQAFAADLRPWLDTLQEQLQA